MHDICNLFGAALNRARHELGLTQIELAEKLGTTDRSISDLERGKTNPKLDTVYLCLDNDEAGEDACESMMEVLEEMDVDVERLRPQGKDWNDDLCAKRGGHG